MNLSGASLILGDWGQVTTLTYRAATTHQFISAFGGSPRLSITDTEATFAYGINAGWVFRDMSGSPTASAIYVPSVSPTGANYSINANSAITGVNAASAVDLRIGNVDKWQVLATETRLQNDYRLAFETQAGGTWENLIRSTTTDDTVVGGGATDRVIVSDTETTFSYGTSGGWVLTNLVGSAGSSALYSEGVTPSNSNYTIRGDAGSNTYLNGTVSTRMAVNALTRVRVDSSNVQFSPDGANTRVLVDNTRLLIQGNAVLSILDTTVKPSNVVGRSFAYSHDGHLVGIGSRGVETVMVPAGVDNGGDSFGPDSVMLFQDVYKYGPSSGGETITETGAINFADMLSRDFDFGDYTSIMIIADFWGGDVTDPGPDYWAVQRRWAIITRTTTDGFVIRNQQNVFNNLSGMVSSLSFSLSGANNALLGWTFETSSSSNAWRFGLHIWAKVVS